MKITSTLFVLTLFLGVLGLWAQDPPDPPETDLPSKAEPISGRLLIVDDREMRPPPPLFFSTDSQAVVQISQDTVTHNIILNVKVLQGNPEVITLALFGDGEVVSVTGEQVEFWGIRRGAGERAASRFLEIRPKLPNQDGGPQLEAFQAEITAKQAPGTLPGEVDILTLGPGEAVGYAGRVELVSREPLGFEVVEEEGWTAVEVEGESETRRFQTTSANHLRLRLEARGAAAFPVDLNNIGLEGRVDPAAQSVHFTLTGEAKVRREGGGRVRILSGHAALRELPEDEAYAVHLVRQGEGASHYHYDLAFPGAGDFPFRLEFDARLRTEGEWYSFDFSVPASAIIPLRLLGLPEEVHFDGTRAVFPTRSRGEWLGFLPPSGKASAAWRTGRDEAEGKLFFATREETEISVSAGLLRQDITLHVNVLQGKLNEAVVDLSGEGEILAVEGPDVLGWKVTPAGEETRRLTIPVSRPLEGKSQLVIRSQTPVGEFPVTVTPIRIDPVGSVRHSGSLRVGNEGAVRIQLGAIEGMTQLSPSQFSGTVTLSEGATQVYVYRIPAAGYDYEVQADQIMPEVNVSHIALYHMGESGRRIEAAVELDIREAPLREWEIGIPGDYAVVSVQGAGVADHVLGEAPENGTRSLRLLFSEMISGRHLVNLQLEKNEAPAAGEWALPPLVFPEAKTVRGHLGVSATAGYRVTTGATDRLSEVPLTQFPVQKDNLQQAYRLREPGWTASMIVEALGQSVQADVFHLYSLKEGMVYGSVVLNYYVVGAPVSDWRLQVPEELGNVGIDGEDVQTWRREDGVLTVSLHEPALGPATLLLTFEQPMNVAGGSLDLANVVPLDVQGERGFIQVVSPYQVQHEITRASSNLLPLEAAELPAEFRLLASAPSLAAYQYGARPVDLAMDIRWFEPGETADQIIDYASLSSEVSRDGQVATEMRLHVKTRVRQAVRLRLPEKTSLWDAHVDGQAVNARVDGDFTVIPLTPSLDPNHHALVVVRVGQTAGDASRPRLAAPAVDAPIMIREWKVRGDRERLLLPRGKTKPQLAEPVLTETGFEWLQKRGVLTVPLIAAVLTENGFKWLQRQERWVGGVIVFICALVGAFLGRAQRSQILPFVGALFVLAAVYMCGVLVKEGFDNRRVNTQTIELVAPVIPANESLSVEVSQVPVWRAMIQPWGLGAILLGLLLLAARSTVASLPFERASLVLSVILISGGLLAQRMGAPIFFLLLGLWFLAVWFAGCCWVWRRNYRARKQEKRAAEEGETQRPDPDPGGPSAAVVPLWLAFALTGALLGFGSEPARAETLTAERLTQTWRIEGQRLFGELEVTLSGKVGDAMELLKPPAVLTAFTPENENLRVARRVVEGGAVHYDVVLDEDGGGKATAAFELALPQPLTGFDFPTGTAALHHLTVIVDRPGWEITSPAAVRLEPAEGGEGQSSASMILGVAGDQRLRLAPRTRDLAAETSQFYVEVDQVYIPRPGVIDARHRVSLRPSQGRIHELTCIVPEGFTVSDVLLEGLRTWRFDPETRTLRVALETARAEPFDFVVLTQQGAGGLPAEMTLEPLRVNDAAGEVGMLALAFGPDAQPESMTAQGMSVVNLEDFDNSLWKAMEGEADPLVLHRVYRYAADAANVTVRVTPVEPEVRVATRQTLSLGEERLLLTIDLTATVTRAGLFRLRFPVLQGLDVEAVSGSHLDHWSEVTEGDVRLVVLHLNGRSMGELTFAITFSGPAPGPQESWIVPRFTLENAARATGQLVISPDLGIRLQAVLRRNVSQLDTRRLAGKQPGTLAFQLLQDDWELQLRIEQLEPWVTAQVLQEVTLREGQTRTRLALRYQIENAAVKALRLTLPGLTAAEEDSVHATGEAISDLVRVPEEDDLWEIRFQRRMLGNVLVTIEFQQPADRSVNVESISPVTLVEVKQATHWLAVRSSGRLEITREDPDRRWQEADWSTVPGELLNQRDPNVPQICVRAVAPDQPLQIGVERHAVAEALKLRVAEGKFQSILAASGDHVTKAVLGIEVSEKSPLRVTLPDGSTLFNAFVNGQSVALGQEDAGSSTYLFYVFPREDTNRAEVTFAYGGQRSTESSDLELIGPLVGLPLQNITWEVVLPNGYTLAGHDGDLSLRDEGRQVRFNVDRYLAVDKETREQQAENATALLEKANYFLQEGQQDKALEALQNAANSPSLDAASSEDARVQLRQLQTEQAMLGLNTRRQLLALENKIETPAFARNEQMEQAATLNPLLRGQMNYDPQQVDNLLGGNTAEENSALKRMAGRLVSQQSEAEPGLRGIEVTLPARGELLTFHRGVQVNPASPLRLHLAVKRVHRVHVGYVAAVLVACGLLAAGGRWGIRN